MKWLTKTIVSVFLLTSSLVSVKAQKASSELLNPDNHALVMIDYEGQMAFATSSININLLRNNTAVVAGASKIFNIPTVVTTVAEKSFSGPVFPEVTEFYPLATSGYIHR